MTTRDLNHWIMYHEIHKLKRLGFSNRKIAQYLVMDARTVKKHLQLSEMGFEELLLKEKNRNRLLNPYEDFVRERLDRFPETSTAQMHDWLKELYPEFPDTSPRTVYNFVMYVRQKHSIPVEKPSRDYFPVPELPYGDQAQIDFGFYNMRLANGKRKKVSFFSMVLSRSRMKYIWFWDRPYIALDVCQAHEKAFAFFGGIPRTIVYDQDRTLMVDENIGDVILTASFREYTRSRGFDLHFCRKADPESKGKVENVVQYVKKNFLYNRTYWDIETLNTEAAAWLARTANALVHHFTQKVPEREHQIEREHLAPFVPMAIVDKETKFHHVRKTNVIAYKGNFYSVPMGTYKGSETKVIVKERDQVLEISTVDGDPICTHRVFDGKGKIIANTHHKRDTSRSLEEMMSLAVAYFTDGDKATLYLREIGRRLPRYTRDHLRVILAALERCDRQAADRALEFCVKNDILHGHDFEQVLCVESPVTVPSKRKIKPLGGNHLNKADQWPETSNLDDYQSIIDQE